MYTYSRIVSTWVHGFELLGYDVESCWGKRWYFTNVLKNPTTGHYFYVYTYNK
jgi:hypothetical protein